MTRTDDGAGSAQPNPPDHLTGGDSVVLHEVERDEGARPAQPSFAMDSQSPKRKRKCNVRSVFPD